MAAENDLFRLYRYDPSMAAACIFTVLFILVTAIHLYQMLRTRAWIFVHFVIGGFFEWIGYISRAISSSQTPNWTVRPYVLQTLLLLIAPALFAASIYTMLGRIILLTDGEAHSLIRKRWLTKIFVCGDIISFLMQGAGGGIMASGTPSALSTGERIVIGGLVVQLLFFGFFLLTGITFHVRLRKFLTSGILGSSIPWERHLYVLYGVSLLILVRSLFRLVEYAQGNDGYLMSHEVYLYTFDGVLMLATMCLLAWIHPSEVNALLKGSNTKAIRHIVSVYSLN
ncbi:putative RTM1-like protein [Zopfia rhizophila CBS 207.26]|uniref:Putative RTM1-like protein n=1 Tax=Zopfia rhizophila CBS 207.26 TaxID=1314779 RepID=A0A6A6DUZ8_9PEZI|nr:putative RTM1-like protein [Zopfia rhizophila CBS 207.26]